MKMKKTVSSVIIAVTQSKWLQPAALTLVVAVVFVGITGCQPHH